MTRTTVLGRTAAVALLGAFLATGAPLAAQGSDAPGKSPTTNPSAATQGAGQSGPSKFYGTISAVDTKANTFVIDDQTYVIVADTELTKAADGTTATIADAIVGETARGTFTRTSDGKLHVTKVRFGKKTGAAGGGKSGGGGGKSGGNNDKAAATTQPKGE